MMEVTPHANCCSFRTIVWSGVGAEISSPLFRSFKPKANPIRFLQMCERSEIPFSPVFGGLIASPTGYPQLAPPGSTAVDCSIKRPEI